MRADKALVLVTTSFPVCNDGSEAAGAFVADLAIELSKSVPVRVVAPGPDSGVHAYADGVQVHRFMTSGKPLSTLSPWSLTDLMSIRKVLRSGMEATTEAVAAGTCSGVLALWALPSGHWARIAARRANLPYSVWTLGSDIWSLGRIPLVSRYLRRVLADAQHCYSDGLRLAEDTRRLGGRDVDFLPSTRRIEGKRTRPLRSNGPYRLVFLGRWHPNKGIDLLLDALHRLSNADWSLIEAFEICGGGGLQPLVQQEVGRLVAMGRPVSLRGFLDKAEAEKLIGGADYLVLPSRIESIPVVFSDAMKLGCPVLASPVGDLPLLMSGEDAPGMIADSVDAAAFARMIAAALHSDASRSSTAVERMAKRFDITNIAGRILSDQEYAPHA